MSSLKRLGKLGYLNGFCMVCKLILGQVCAFNNKDDDTRSYMLSLSWSNIPYHKTYP